jgi:hypothetical protein
VWDSVNPAIHDDSARALSKNGAPEDGPRADGQGARRSIGWSARSTTCWRRARGIRRDG